jgi:hypothetical protein
MAPQGERPAFLDEEQHTNGRVKVNGHSKRGKKRKAD